MKYKYRVRTLPSGAIVAEKSVIGLIWTTVEYSGGFAGYAHRAVYSDEEAAIMACARDKRTRNCANTRYLKDEDLR